MLLQKVLLVNVEYEMDDYCPDIHFMNQQGILNI